MKAGLLGPFPPFRGGIATFNTHLYRTLAERVDVVALNYRRQYPGWIFPGRTQLDESACPFTVGSVTVFDPFRPWRWPADLRALDALALDWLLLSLWTPLFAPSLWLFLSIWQRRSGRPMLAVCHNVRPHESIPLTGFFQTRLLRRLAGVAVHWQGDADQLHGWLPGTPVATLFHPLYDSFPREPGLDRTAARRRLGLPEEARVLLFFGLVRPYKGLDLLLEAFQSLADADARLHLLVAGEFYEPPGKYEPRLGQLRQANRLTLHDRFIPNERVADYFTAADAVVLPYRSATQSGIVPLAYAMGRGVVASRVGGVPEMVEDGVTGILVPPADAPELASGIARFLDGQSAIESAVPGMAARFGWPRYADGLLELARRVV